MSLPTWVAELLALALLAALAILGVAIGSRQAPPRHTELLQHPACQYSGLP